MRVTKRPIIHHDLKTKIGDVFRHNCFPTFRGRLLYIMDEKCYFVIESNPEVLKYECFVGRIEYLPLDMVIRMRTEDEEERKKIENN